MRRQQQRWCSLAQAQILGFSFLLILLSLTGCDSTPLSSPSSAGAAGPSGSTSASGSSGSSGSSSTPHGPIIKIPTTTKIVVKVPSTAAGSAGSGGTSGSSSETGGSAGTSTSPVVQCVPAQPAGTDTGVCGDGFRSPAEACDDGNTLSGDGCSPTCQITPQLVSQRLNVLGTVTRIHAGGDAVESFGVDRFYTDGSFYRSTNVVSTTGVANAAPSEVYQTERAGNFSYNFNGLTPRVVYTLRLHFAEVWYGDDDAGTRVFNVEVNGAPVLENFDIVSVAGGANKAVVREFSAAANSAGQIIVKFVSLLDNAKVSGLELFPPANQAPLTVEPILRLNGGGDEAVGSFEADQFVVGGGTYSNGNEITTSGVANAAPAAVYQSERWGNFSYTLDGLAPGAQYVVRLHFAEIYFSTPGSRAFNVSINDAQVLEKFDIVKEAGEPNKAVVRDFSAVANSAGKIVVSFEGGTDNAKVSGLELLRPVTSRSIGAARHPLAAGCNTVGVTFSDHNDDSADVFLSTFESAGRLVDSVRVAQTHVSTPAPGVAALPGDDFVVSWTDFDDDELGISLRKVVGGVPQGKSIVANEDPAFSQSESDIVFDGNELVVAWTDSHDPANGPDLHYRLFTPELVPISGDQVLAATDAVEDNVVLAGRNGHWAAAWRSGSQGKETIEVQSGPSHWTVGPFLPGATEDRPDLIFLDDTRLAVAFTKGTDPDNTGEANVPRLHEAVLDPRMPGATESFELAPVRMLYATDTSIGQTEPSLVLASDHVLVGWRAKARPGDHLGSELWSRRVPFTVTGDTVTLDPSHLEMPLIQTDAQREGDQGAFRMVATTLWPGGGLVAAWTDLGRSLQKAGSSDVAMEFLPDLPELPPAVTTYPLSADGKYYVVNLLRRSYPPPTVSATYANDAAVYVNSYSYGPQYALDGDGSTFTWVTPAPSGDSDAVVTMTVDMGQYFSIGAIRPLYYRDGLHNPLSQRIRVATIPGNWTTVAPMGPVASLDTTLSFAPVVGRFLELTMVGTPVGNSGGSGAELTELFVYPSAQTSPPPTSVSGYDLTYMSTTSVNENFFVPGVQWPMRWPAGDFYAKTLAQGATGDGVGTIDLGSQYGVSRIKLGFVTNAQTWANGGRLELAAIPDLYSVVEDSGLGQSFPKNQTEYRFPTQSVRYIRATNYFTPGVGLSPGLLWSVQAFGNTAPVTAYYPLSDDGKYFNVNLLRHAQGTPQPTASVVYSNGAVTRSTPTESLFDGDDLAFRWMAPGLAGDPNPQVTLTIDLGEVQSVGAIRQWYNAAPLRFSLRAAQTLGSWTQVIPDTPLASTFLTSSFDATQARYLELTVKGTMAAYGVVDFIELEVFPSSTTDPAPDSSGSYDRTYLTGGAVSGNASMALAGSPVQSRFPQYIYGKTVAQGATDDAVATFDLGQAYRVSHVGLAFFGADTWVGGGKIEVDDGSGTWATVRDSGRGTRFGSTTGGLVSCDFSERMVRYVRVTDYFVSGVGASFGRIFNVEAF